MRRHQTKLAAAAIALLLAGGAGAEEYMLYTPKKVEKAETPANPRDGVLVQSRVLRKGDTLSRLSRETTGRGSYYPQILLFNRIANPDLIYAGDTLLIPVPAKRETAKVPVRHHKKRKAPLHSGPSRQPAALKTVSPTAEPVVTAAPQATAKAPAQATVSAEQRAFDRAMGLYTKKKYARAAEQFERFLKTYPTSPQAPDAALYKAECYEKMAGN